MESRNPQHSNDHDKTQQATDQAVDFEQTSEPFESVESQESTGDQAQEAEAEEESVEEDEVDEESAEGEADEESAEDQAQEDEEDEESAEDQAQEDGEDEESAEGEAQEDEAEEEVAEDQDQEGEADEESAEDQDQVEADEESAEDQATDKPWHKHYPDEIRKTLDYPEVNIAQFLIDAATNYPNNKAIQFMGKTLTYKDLYAVADQLARGLYRLGVHKGDRVAIMLPNCPQAVISYYGVLLAGAIVVQTNPLYMEREIQHQLQDSGAVTLITIDLLYPRIDKVRGKQPELGPLPNLKNVIITSIKDGLPFPKNVLYPIKQRREGFKSQIRYGHDGYIEWKSLLSRNSKSFERPTLAEHHEVAALQYTGGTTGTPKGVMLTHRNLVSNTIQTMEWCSRIKVGEERFLAALPLFHVFGLTVLMNLSVRSAGCLILLPKFDVNEVLRTIVKMKPTIFPGAPTMYVALIQAASKQAISINLSSIEICISGSAALPLEVQEQFETLTGGRLIEGYGLTESSPVTHANPIWGKRKIGTIGLPFPDTDAAIISVETGERLPAGELGELIVKGPQVMRGYWNKEEATAEALQDGWLRTGDLAMMDDDGYFIIMDRIKDIIIASGFNIYPREIEEVLYEHPAIAEASVVGIKDAYRGETVKAFIVLKENYSASEEQLDLWCRERLAAFKVPHKYAFRDSLPKTMVGKVLRRKLAEEE